MQELSRNTTLSHYRIVSKIGAGGMGEAYLRREAKEINKWKEMGRKKYVSSYWLAISCAALGENDKTFAELEKSYQANDCCLER